MIELALFASAFITVFALGFQQQNVIHRHYKAAALTSFAIGASQIFLWRTLPGADASQITATLMGGPVGITAAMYLHPRLLKRKHGTTRQPNNHMPCTTASPENPLQRTAKLAGRKVNLGPGMPRPGRSN